MVYFTDEEIKTIKEMIEYYDDCDSRNVPSECAELIGVIRFKICSERKYDLDDLEGGVDE